MVLRVAIAMTKSRGGHAVLAEDIIVFRILVQVHLLYDLHELGIDHTGLLLLTLVVAHEDDALVDVADPHTADLGHGPLRQTSLARTGCHLHYIGYSSFAYFMVVFGAAFDAYTKKPSIRFV